MEVVMLVLPMVKGLTWETVVGVTEGVLWLMVEEMLVWGMEGLMRGIVAGSLRFYEYSGKTSTPSTPLATPTTPPTKIPALMSTPLPLPSTR